MPCSDSQPTRNVSVAGFVAGGAGGVITQIAAKACCARLQKRYGGAAYGQIRSSTVPKCLPPSGLSRIAVG
jgi:hypothetical protein